MCETDAEFYFDMHLFGSYYFNNNNNNNNEFLYRIEKPISV